MHQLGNLYVFSEILGELEVLVFQHIQVVAHVQGERICSDYTSSRVLLQCSTAPTHCLYTLCHCVWLIAHLYMGCVRVHHVCTPYSNCCSDGYELLTTSNLLQCLYRSVVIIVKIVQSYYFAVREQFT